MIRAEIKVNSIVKEIETIKAKIERETARDSKRVVKAQELGSYFPTFEDWVVVRDNGEVKTWSEKKYKALYIVGVDDRELKDLYRRLENNEKRLAKASGILEDQLEKIEADKEFTAKCATIESLILSKEEAEKKYQEWLKKFKAECLKDGVVIDEATANMVNGTTKSGKRFILYINNGFTERSFHCYTLRINGATIFTSGTFETCYSVIAR